MAGNEFPESKRPRRTLSQSRHRRKSGSKNNEAEVKGPPVSSSIVSFFNNVLPAKIACPLCGQLVPRYGINRHIDEACPKSCEDDAILVDSAAEVGAGPSIETGSGCSSPYFANDASTPEKSPSPLENRDLKAKGAAGEQTSPYFKKGSTLVLSDGESRVQVVKNLSLGSLSTKLARRRRVLGGSSVAQEAKSHPTQDASDCSVERNPEGLLCADDFQKENRFPSSVSQEPRSPKERLTSKRGTLGVAPQGDAGMFHVGFDDSSSVGLVPLGDCTEQEPPVGVSEQWRSPEGSASDLCKLAASSALCTKAEVSNLESGDFSGGEPFPLANAGRVCDHQMENVSPVGGDVGGQEDVRNDVTDDVCLGPLEEVHFRSPSGSILETVLHGLGPASDSGDCPYYLRNFLMVLQAVLENEEDRSLFDEEDLGTIVKFYQLSAGGQKLYVRLFQRKLNWIKVCKIEYAEIGKDLSLVIEELIGAGFLQDEAGLQELSEGLDLLSAPELKTLAKAFHLANPSAPKPQLLADFLRLAKQRSVFSRNRAGVASAILKRAKDLAGKSIRVCRGPRAVFSRVLLLFSLTDPVEDEEAGSGGQGQLSTVLMVNMGRMAFPVYTVNRKTPIFQDRGDFIRYATAAHTLSDIAVAMTNGKWKEAHRLYEAAKETWHGLKDCPSLRHHAALPEYLRRFTVGWVYTRILSRGVEILQRLQMYEEAVELLQVLLGQEVYCPDSRGRWWDRLALNLHQHLKDTEKAVICIGEGLLDPFVRTGHRLSLSQRAQRMKDSPACKKLKHLLQGLPVLSVEDVAHVTIKGKLCPQTGMGKSVFIMEDLGAEDQAGRLEPSTVVCSVEELALAHYKQNGFDQGIHGEGSTFLTLYGLLMWDVLFMDGVPDVFRNPYQALPLDLYTDSFYENRREALESRLQFLKDASSETLKELMGEVWNAQLGKATALISWDRFGSLQQAQALACCFGGRFLSGVCQRLSRDLRHCRGGLPDLVVWRTEDRQFKLVEVKGPNDRLSYKQMIWLAELQKLGAVVEVCHVVAIGSKSKRLS